MVKRSIVKSDIKNADNWRVACSNAPVHTTDWHNMALSLNGQIGRLCHLAEGLLKELEGAGLAEE